MDSEESSPISNNKELAIGEDDAGPMRPKVFKVESNPPTNITTNTTTEDDNQESICDEEEDGDKKEEEEIAEEDEVEESNIYYGLNMIGILSKHCSRTAAYHKDFSQPNCSSEDPIRVPYDKSKQFRFLLTFGLKKEDVDNNTWYTTLGEKFSKYILELVDSSVCINSSQNVNHVKQDSVRYDLSDSLVGCEDKNNAENREPDKILTNPQEQVRNSLNLMYDKLIKIQVTKNTNLGGPLSSNRISKVFLIGPAGTGKTTLLNHFYKDHKNSFLYLTHQHALCQEVVRNTDVPNNQAFTFCKILKSLGSLTWADYVQVEKLIKNFNCSYIYEVIDDIRKNLHKYRFNEFNQLLFNIGGICVNFKEPLIVCLDEFSMIPNNMIYLLIALLDGWCRFHKKKIMLIFCGNCHHLKPFYTSECVSNDEGEDNVPKFKCSVDVSEAGVAVEHPFDHLCYKFDNLNINCRCLFLHGRELSDKYLILSQYVKDTRKNVLQVQEKLISSKNNQELVQHINNFFKYECNVRNIDFSYPALIFNDELLEFFKYPDDYCIRQPEDKVTEEGSSENRYDEDDMIFLLKLYNWWLKVKKYFKYFCFRSFTNLDAHFMNIQLFYSVFNQLTAVKVSDRLMCKLAYIYLLDQSDCPHYGIFTTYPVPVTPLILGMPYKMLKSYKLINKGEIVILLYIHDTIIPKESFLICCKEIDPRQMFVVRPDIVTTPLFCNGTHIFQYQCRNSQGKIYIKQIDDDDYKQLYAYPIDLAINGTIRSSVGCSYDTDLYLNLSGASKEDVYVSCTRVTSKASIKGIQI
ncbi:uncharacterized protein LOC141538340 [Cotesia typhae]|uniref:uncharacterized protein LOC141538340 n=1 Tax=Cotesia typhae TaxID=2053667 RepID=UPI003D689080